MQAGSNFVAGPLALSLLRKYQKTSHDSGDSRIKIVGDHCGAEEKVGGPTHMPVLHGDFSSLWLNLSNPT